MIDKKIEDALNRQINNEIYSAYLYQSMSAHTVFLGLKGFANWFSVQKKEELFHARKIYDFINSRGGRVKLFAVKEPPSEFESPLDMFEKTLKHEQFITGCMNDLVDLAVEEKDHATQIFLQWFVTEQIEEEENDRDIIDRLKLIGDDGNGLLMLDKELMARIFNPPAASG